MREPVTVTQAPNHQVATVSIPLAGNGTDDASYRALAALRDRVIPSTIGSIDGVTAEHNALGYSGTNAGGNLQIVRSMWRFNWAGIVPNTLDTENVQANYEHGVLKIELAKRAEAKPKQIKVNIGGGSKSLGKTVEGNKAESKSTAA